MNIDLFGNVIVDQEEFSVETAKASPFTFITNITKKQRPESLDGYVSFLTNLNYSQNKDTVVFANEMNKYHNLNESQNFDFYFHSLPKKNFFSKWAKAPKEEFSESVKEYYNVSDRVAFEYIRTLTEEQLKEIKKWFDNRRGGKK